MAQPAVSRSIQELEAYYGVQLFERMNRRLHVTQAGKLFYPYALHLVSTLEKMERGLRNWEELGQIRVGTTITLGNYLLPQVLKEFQSHHPGLKLRSTISNGTQILQGVRDDLFDFAVVEGTFSDDTLCKREIAPDQLVLILPPGEEREGPLKLGELSRERLLLREEGSMGRSLVNGIFEQHGLQVSPYMESVSTQAIVRAVHEGLGVSFLPKRLVQEDLNSGFVATRQLHDASLWRPNYLVWHRQKFLTATAKELMQLFADKSRRNP